MKPRVLISVPNGDGWIHKTVAFCLFRMLADPRVEAEVILPTWKPYVHNLHRIIKDVIDQKFDYWVNIDDDNPPKKNPVDLVFLDKDIIGCPTPIWQHDLEKHRGQFPIAWSAFRKAEDGDYRPVPPREFVGGKLVECDVVGSGCLVVATRVLATLGRANPVERWFMREWGEDGFPSRGGDFAFCERAKKRGFQVFSHGGYVCEHDERGAVGRGHRSIRRLLWPIIISPNLVKTS